MNLLLQKRFGPLFWTQFFGALNDNVLKNSFVLLAVYKGLEVGGLTAATIVAAAGGVFILPFVLFSALAGEIADKYEKSAIVRVVKWAEILIMVMAAIGFYTQNGLFLLFTVFLMGVQSTFFGPLKYSMLPELLSEEELITGNAFVETGTFIAILIGMILGGVLAALDDPNLLISITLFIMAIAGLIASYGIPEVRAGSPDLKISKNPFPTLISNFKIIKEKVAIYNSVLAVSWFWFLGAGVLSVLPGYIKDTLFGDEHVANFVLAIFTTGIGIGSMLCAKFSYKRVELGLLPIGAIGMSIFAFDLYLTNPDWAQPETLYNLTEFLKFPTALRLCFDFLMFSIFGGIFIVPLYTLIQERSHPESRSRVIAGLNVVNAIFMVVSSIMLMVLYKLEFNYQQIFLTYCILNLIVSFYVYSVVPEFTLRFYSWVLVRFIYKLEVEGQDNIPKDGPVVLACNHVSFVDWLILSGVCKRPSRFIMYYKFFEIPIAKTLMKHAKVIPIAGQSEDPVILENAFKKISQELTEGEVVAIFPEGGLTNDGKIHPFKPGILKILEKNPVPVVPMAIHGLWGSLFTRIKDGRRSLFRKKIKLVIGEPISPKDFKLAALEQEIRRLAGEPPLPENPAP